MLISLPRRTFAPSLVRMSAPTATATASSTSLRVLTPSHPLTPPAFYRPPSSHPPHWKGANPLQGSGSSRGFESPWPSDNKALVGLMSFLKTRLLDWDEQPIKRVPGVRKATFLEEGGQAVEGEKQSEGDGNLRYTWLGHAACHLQIPVPVAPAPASTSTSAGETSGSASSSGSPSGSSQRTLNVLTDPVFSQRCSPFQFMGPARYTQPPTSVADLASSRAWPDVVLISHNHYDHLDYNTMRLIAARPQGRELPVFVVPLGLAAWFRANMKELPEEKLVEVDWWDERIVEARFRNGGSEGKAEESVGRLRIVCTPAQHFSGRGLADQGHTLWASYALHVLPPSSSSSSSSSTPSLARIWFSGDTGYRSVPRKATREQENALPHCPAFSEIGSLLGPFDLSLIACGAYDPRGFMSRIHAAPHESVRIHQEIQSRKTFGIHHSTFRLTPEEVNEPAARLLEEARLAGCEEGEVENVEIGETRVVEFRGA